MNLDLREMKPALGRAVDALLAKAPYASALAQARGGTIFKSGTRASAVEPVDPVAGVVLSAWNGRTMLEVAVPDLDERGIEAATKKLADLVADEGVHDGPRIDPGAAIEQDFVVAEAVRADEVPFAEKLHAAERVKDRIHAHDPRVKNAVVRATHLRTQELFVGPTRRLYQDLRRAEVVCFVVMEEGGRAADLHAGRGRQGGAENFDVEPHLTEELVEDCARLLRAERIPGGTYACVFDPDMAGLFAHEAFGHGTEADMFTRRRAKGADYMGQRVASELVDMFDNPALPGQAASYYFDHEGQLASCTQIIEKGVLKAPMTDLVSATKLGAARTANGRRESVARKAYTRMSNTYFGPGKQTFDELLQALGDGLLVRRARNGMEDPKGWGIQCEAYLAEEVKGGKRTGKIFGPIIVTGYVPDLLMSIDGVSKDVEIGGLGMCGKGYKEWVKVTDGGPALKLKARVA